MARPENEKSKESRIFDLSDWHAEPDCIVTAIPNPGNGGAYVFCSTCHCLADAEAVGTRITAEASKHK